jgi:hypothetical protein
MPPSVGAQTALLGRAHFQTQLLALRAVLQNQTVLIGKHARPGQLYSFEYPVLQAAELQESPFVFHLGSLRVSKERPLLLRYIRVTVNFRKNLTSAEDAQIHILIGGKQFLEERKYYGQITGEDTALHSRSLVIGAGAKFTTRELNDETRLSGRLANIALRHEHGGIPIRIVLPRPLHRTERLFSTALTASLEMVLSPFD